MIFLWMVLACFLLNCNRLHDSGKWPLVWCLALSSGADVIMFQETHLTVEQECSFGMFAQAFDKFYAHGTSQSGGIMVAVRRALNYMPVIVCLDAGHKLVLDLVIQGESLRLISIYAPNDPKLRTIFYQWLSENIVPGNTFLMGDFNSVMKPQDQLSQNLDQTSHLLASLLEQWGLEEVSSGPSFMYQHPSVAGRKSRIDHLYVLQDFVHRLFSYTQWCSCSDHLAVISALKPGDKGPSQWHLPENIFENPVVPGIVQKEVNAHSELSTGLCWESIKLHLCTQFQDLMKYHQVQHDQELRSLRQILRMINRQIYLGEHDLEQDLYVVQNVIQTKEKTIWEKDKLDVSAWIEREGTCYPNSLHLEDIAKQQTVIDFLLDNTWHLVNGDSVLDVLNDFYTELYRNCDSVDQSETELFLSGIVDVPKISNGTAATLLGDIMEQEVFNAIGKLKKGKVPGLDGLTIDFYKKFASLLAPVLVNVFNEAFKDGELPPSLHLAVKVLLYKKGLKEEAGNYRPISLTNVDYKILVYVLTEHLKLVLKEVIHPSQMAYIPGKFIGTNIRKVQDAIDYAKATDKEWVVLFLDFQKAFDSVSHLFLVTMLRTMGFPVEYIA